MNKVLAITLIAALLTGCAGAAYRPMIDSTRGPGNYEKDLIDCQDYAKQVVGGAEGAIFGAILGALLGAALGGGHGLGNEMAGFGAATGALSVGAAGENNQRDVIRRCMAGRGYSVLN